MQHSNAGRAGTPLAVIFFDLDGTLCAPTIPFRDVFGDVLTPVFRRRADLTLDGVLQCWGTALMQPGPSTTAGCLRQILATSAVDPDEDSLADLADRLNARWAASQALVPSARTVLETLSTSWPLGLITNGPRDAQRAVVAALDIASYFRWLLVSGDTAIGSRKPAPAIFAKGARLAGCSPSAALYVGDSAANDVAGAAAAGWRTCWVNARAATLPASVPQPDLEIRALADLPTVIAGARARDGDARQ